MGSSGGWPSVISLSSSEGKRETSRGNGTLGASFGLSDRIHIHFLFSLWLLFGVVVRTKNFAGI